MEIQPVFPVRVGWKAVGYNSGWWYGMSSTGLESERNLQGNVDASERAPVWAPRLPRGLIRRLYELDAQGICDDELIDEVGYGLRARCQSFIAAVEAVSGRAPCPVCGEVIHHHSQPEELLRCPGCGWETTWGAYFKTIQHKQLSGAQPVLAFYQEFVDRFPQTQGSREKMLLIDVLIHGFHIHLKYGPTRAVVVNLIEGSYHEVVDFLDSLSYGPGSTPGLAESYEEWRRTINFTADAWHDERLRRK